MILRAYSFLTGWLRNQEEKNIVLVSGDDMDGALLILYILTCCCGTMLKRVNIYPTSVQLVPI